MIQTYKRAIRYIAVCFIVLLVTYVSRLNFLGVNQDSFNDVGADFSYLTPTEEGITQKLTMKKAALSLNFLYRHGGTENAVLHMELLEAATGESLKTETLSVAPSGGNETLFAWDIHELEIPEMTEVILKILPQNPECGFIYCIQKSGGGLDIIDQESLGDWHLRMSILYNQSIYWEFVLLFALTLLATGLGCLRAYEKQWAPEKLFVLIALTAGVGVAFINPLAQEPDGWLHFIRTIDVSYGNLLAPFANIAHKGGYNMLPVNIEDIQVQIIDPNLNEGAAYLTFLQNMVFSKEARLFEGECGYSSLFYLPQAIGTRIGLWTSASVYSCMVLGRLCNLLAYVGLTYTAIKKMPFFKNILLVIALLPLSIYQAASFSTDSVLNGVSFLLIALCFSYAYEQREDLGIRQMLPIGILLAALFTCKYVYAGVGLLVFLIPQKSFGSKKNYWKNFALAVLPLLAVVGFFGIRLMIGMLQGGDATAGGPAQEVTMTQLGYVLSNPTVLFSVFTKTIEEHMETNFRWLNTLGWLNYELNLLIVTIPCFMFGVACLDTKEVPERFWGKEKWLCVVTGILVVVFGMLGLYLMDGYFNPVGAPVITGYQTRYILPVMGLLMMAFAGKHVTNKISGFSVKVMGVMGISLAYTLMMLAKLSTLR